MSKWLSLGVIALAGVSTGWAADEPARADGKAAEQAPSPAQVSQLCKIDVKGDKKEQWIRLPKAESSVTQHHINVRGKSLDYTATAGTLIIRQPPNDGRSPIWRKGFAYLRASVNHPPGRNWQSLAPRPS